MFYSVNSILTEFLLNCKLWLYWSVFSLLVGSIVLFIWYNWVTANSMIRGYCHFSVVCFSLFTFLRICLELFTTEVLWCRKHMCECFPSFSAFGFSQTGLPQCLSKVTMTLNCKDVNNLLQCKTLRSLKLHICYQFMKLF